MFTGVHFFQFAGHDSRTWEKMIGQELSHSQFGTGTICAVTHRDDRPTLIEVSFESPHGHKLFSSESFRNGRVTRLDVPEQFRKSVEAVRAAWEREEARLAEEQRIQAEKTEASEAGRRYFSELAEKFKVRVDSVVSDDGPTVIAPILLKLEAREPLDEMALRSLSAYGLHNVLATYHFRNYKQNGDLWELARACKSLRRAGQPETVIQITNHGVKQDGNDHRAHAAVLTSRGGAYRDLDDVNSAKSCAERALVLNPRGFYAHNLLGALAYQVNNFEEGDRHFDMALRLGAQPRQQDSQIRVSIERSGLEERRAIVEYLLAKNYERYKWAMKFI